MYRSRAARTSFPVASHVHPAYHLSMRSTYSRAAVVTGAGA